MNLRMVSGGGRPESARCRGVVEHADRMGKNRDTSRASRAARGRQGIRPNAEDSGGRLTCVAQVTEVNRDSPNVATSRDAGARLREARV
jgi:hypothetical protein